MKPLREVFRDNLQRIWEEKNLSETKMAEETGLSSTYCGKLKRGDRVPTFETVDQIADGLKIPRDELLT